MARFLALLLALIGLAPAAAQPRPPLVLAAASLQESMNAAADAWARGGHPRPTISFAGSSTLARQVLAGAPADLFVSADPDWMDQLQKAGRIVPATRVDLLGNRLVVVSRSGAPVPVAPPAALARALAAGPLAMADPDAVPAGLYGRAALTRLGVWAEVAPHVVRAADVRAALALVERGAAPFGIVYATDAAASKAVHVSAVFPAATHPPIVYPLARLAGATNPESEGFRRFLMSPAGKAIFRRFGFETR
jgi:molybdate transport system substrate-binding protein